MANFERKRKMALSMRSEAIVLEDWPVYQLISVVCSWRPALCACQRSVGQNRHDPGTGIPFVRVGDLYVQVDVLSPTSRAGEALTSEPWPIRGFIVNPIQPRRSASAPARLSAPNPQSPEEHLSRNSPPAPMCWVAAPEPDGRRTLSVQADITGSTLRLILRLDSLHLGAQRVGARAYASSYCRSSCPSSPMATPETVPSNSPVSVPSTTPPEALNNTADNIAVNVRAPDAPLKRPVPPVI